MSAAFFTSDEERTVRALVERIFPDEGDGPGAAEAGVTEYIDGQLAGDWGAGARMYLQGPFTAAEHDGHGWQSPLTPAAAYRSSLGAIARHVRRRFSRDYADLAPADQDAVIVDLERDRVPEMTEVSGADFFRMLRQGVIEGMFADPFYGGNRGMVSWRWLGYPGVASAHGRDYAENVDKPGVPYTAAPEALP